MEYLAFLNQQWLSDTVVPWLQTSGLRILFIIISLYIGHRIVKVLITRLIVRVVKASEGESKSEEERREATLIRVVHTTMHILVVLVGLLMALSELGLDTGPLIAAAGIGGLAFGFGGQYLIKDLINGVFILMENQYRVGDVVCFGKTCGMVEDVNLRRTILRDLDGVVHTIPNGAISIASNMTKQFGRVNLEIGVSYSTDLDKLIKVVNKVGNDMADDPQWKNKIKQAPQFLRVNEFADSAIVIKILGETISLEQWAVTGELRKRLKIAFDKEGIEIPFPQRVVHQAKE